MYAIIGVTGHVGSVAANILLEKKLPVRAVIRNPSKSQEWIDKGAEVAIAGLNDAEALTQAFANTEGVFVMTPPLFDAVDPKKDHDEMLAALSIAIEKAKPAKVVYLSSVGAQHAEGTGAIGKLYDMERAFKQLNIPTAGIRAAWFMENFTGSIANAKDTGKLFSFLNPTDKPIPMIAAADIGKLAAELLLEDWHGHRIIELEGPCRYSADDVAMILGYQLNQPVTAIAIPDKDYEATYRSFGFTQAAAEMMAQMNRGFNSKHIVFEDKGITRIEGETLLEDVISKYIGHHDI